MPDFEFKPIKRRKARKTDPAKQPLADAPRMERINAFHLKAGLSDQYDALPRMLARQGDGSRSLYLEEAKRVGLRLMPAVGDALGKRLNQVMVLHGPQQHVGNLPQGGALLFFTDVAGSGGYLSANLNSGGQSISVSTQPARGRLCLLFGETRFTLNSAGSAFRVALLFT